MLVVDVVVDNKIWQMVQFTKLNRQLKSQLREVPSEVDSNKPTKGGVLMNWVLTEATKVVIKVPDNATCFYSWHITDD